MKKVKLKLVGLDSNIYYLLGAFEKQAKREEWTSEEIAVVNHEVHSSKSYDEALYAISSRCVEPKEPIDW